MLLFAAITNLAMDIGALDSHEVRAQALELEQRISSWRGCSTTDETATGLARVDQATTEEMWRIGAMIHLNTSVRRLGPMATCLRQALGSILTLGAHRAAPSQLHPRASSFMGAERACPWFLASMLALSSEERAACRTGLLSCGPHKVVQDNLAAAELVWGAWDETGYVAEWRQCLKARGVFAGFF
jgi:hypothetical protein